MTSKEKLLEQIAGLYQNFKINKSRLSGILKITEQYGLKVDSDEDPEKWTVFEAESGDYIPWQKTPDKIRKSVEDFIIDWRSLDGEKKKPLNNLKEGGFEGLPENQEEELKKEEQKATEKKARYEREEKEKKATKEEHAPNCDDSTPEKSQETPIEDPEEKARLAREENEKKLAMMEQAEQEEALNEQKKASQKPGISKQPQDKQAIFTDRPVEYVDVPTPKKGEVNLVDVLQSICKNDLMQIFGNTGTGKTTICTQLAFDAKRRGLKVRYIDTEHNRNEDQVTVIVKAGIKYDCIKRFNKLCEEITRLVRSEEKWDFLIIDSAGAPALATYCKTNMSGQGDILKKFIAMSDDLKTYADDKNCTVLVVNQPESSMNKGEDAILEPFGEKSRYYYKEILKTNYARKGRKTEKTTIVLSAHRSRCMGIDTPICTMEITNDGVKVIQ